MVSRNSTLRNLCAMKERECNDLKQAISKCVFLYRNPYYEEKM